MKLNVEFLHIAVGVIKNSLGEVLISKRADDVHQACLWEFPGGKVEQGEVVFMALKRELLEELAITIKTATPLIKIYHHYSELSVLLDVWLVNDFSGNVYGREGQEIIWSDVNKLSNYHFPIANKGIISAVQLPNCYAILDDTDNKPLLFKFKKILNKGVKLIQARLKNLNAKELKSFLELAMPLCKQYQAKLLINSGVVNAWKIETDGLHLTSTDLMRLNTRPNNKGWLAASCHNLLQLQHAQKIGVDFVVLAPVLTTQTHPNAKILGWKIMAELIEKVSIPVFALGGVAIHDIKQAQIRGAQGIAGITAFL